MYAFFRKKRASYPSNCRGKFKNDLDKTGQNRNLSHAWCDNILGLCGSKMHFFCPICGTKIKKMEKN